MFLSELVPDLLMEVPNLTDVQAMRAIQRAARRFYSETLLWEEQRTYSVSEGTSVVRFLLPIDECSIIAVKRAYFEGDELLPMREPEFMQATELPAAPQPLGYLPKLSDMTALVAPIASVRQDNSYDFTLILAPSMDADELPLDAYSQFEDAYVAGALSKLYASSLFLNPALADLNEGRFNDFVTRAVNLRDNLYTGPAKVVGYGGL